MKKLTELDFSEFPPGTITEYTTLVCLACIFEGRLTLLELLRRMRKGGYLSAHGIEGADQFELFEKLIDEVAGSGALKSYYVVDRREFIDKVKAVYAAYA
jgi:hypothetical protein